MRIHNNNDSLDKNIALVVPTIREEQILLFIDSWEEQLKEAKVKFYIVEDNERPSFNINIDKNSNIEHLTWSDAPSELLSCINVKSPCCRQIGFWKAYNDGFDVIITLDDDTRPVAGKNLFNQFAQILLNGIPVWVDPMINYRSRGYPEKNTGNMPIHFHIGSFLSIPDVDGETQLKYQNEFNSNPPQYMPRVTLLSNKQLIPVNGGICGFRKEMVPFIHYTLWNKELKYRRFDDIWMGIILKRFFDLTNFNMSYGPPFVNHIRASDPNKNILYEVEGKKWNEDFWIQFDKKLEQYVKGIDRTPDFIYEQICLSLESMGNNWAVEEGIAMRMWKKLFAKSKVPQ